MPLFLPGAVPLLEDIAEENPQRDDTEAHDKDHGIQEPYPLSSLRSSADTGGFQLIPVGSCFPIFKLPRLRRRG
jgi:hypothetical protein